MHKMWMISILTIIILLHILILIGTHGSGITFNNIAAMVTRLKLINGEGEILTLSPQENKDIFKAAQVHGCCCYHQAHNYSIAFSRLKIRHCTGSNNY